MKKILAFEESPWLSIVTKVSISESKPTNTLESDILFLYEVLLITACNNELML